MNMAKTSKNKKAAPKITIHEKHQFTMKVVTSSTCDVCKQQCQKGLQYLEKMSKPGALGKGVACHLTKGKVIK